MRSILKEWLPTNCPRAKANGRYIVIGGSQNAKHFKGMASDELPASESERALHCNRRKPKCEAF